MALEPTCRKDLGELHKLLLKACPAKALAAGSIRSTLAPALGVSHQYVYRWIEENRVPPKFVAPLVEISQGRVSREELIPYAVP